MKITKKLIKDYLARMPRAVVHHGIDGDVDRQPMTGTIHLLDYQYEN